MFGNFTIENSTITFNDATRFDIHNYSGNYIRSPYVAASIFICRDHYLIFELDGFQSKVSRAPKAESEFEQELQTRSTPYWFDNCHIFYDALQLTYNETDQQFQWLPVRSDIGVDEYLLPYALTMTLYKKQGNALYSFLLSEQQLYEDGFQNWEMLGIGIIEKVG